MDKNTPTSSGIPAEPAYTPEVIKEMYNAFRGNQWMIWHEYGNAFGDSCLLWNYVRNDETMG